MRADPVVETYSLRADEYAGLDNQGSCWGLASQELWSRLDVRDGDRTVMDVGCGDGTAMVALVDADTGNGTASRRFVGVEPAEGLRALAELRHRGRPSVTIVDGRFEGLPVDAATVDYLYSIMAFHWVSSPAAGVAEIDRVLARQGRADLFFVGRRSGREFIRATTPIFLRHLGPARLFEAASLRQQLTRDEAEAVFRVAMPTRQVDVTEWYDTRYDTLDGHLGWWVRIEGQLLELSGSRRDACEVEVRAALERLRTPAGVPYTLHLLHVAVRARPDGPDL